jgi:hypothetical protein
MNKNIKVAIFGASNEISPEGWTKSLNFFDLIKGSVGASSSSAGIFNMLKLDLDGADFAIFSYELNEDVILSKGLMDQQRLINNWRWLFLTCRARGCEPVLLILPKLNKSGFYKSLARKLQMEIASQMSVSTIDFSDFFNEYSDVNPQKFMLDNVHMVPLVAQAVGRYIQKCLFYIYETPLIVDQSVLDVDYHVGWCCNERNLDRSVERKTSAVTAKLLKMCESDCFVISVPKGSEMIAMIGNRLSNGGYLEINNRVVKKFHFLQSQSEVGKYMSIVLDVCPGLSSEDGGFQIKLNSEGDATEASHMERPFLFVTEIDVEIEALLFSLPIEERLYKYSRRQLKDINLIDVVPLDSLREEILDFTLLE